MKHRWLGIPDILMKKLMMYAGVAAVILAAGIFMEIRQSGEGFLKLTLLCVAGLGCYCLVFFHTICRKAYEVLEGEVTCIQICRGRRKYWEIEVTDGEGEQNQLMVPSQSGVQKGKKYRFYLKNEVLLGVEETL